MRLIVDLEFEDDQIRRVEIDSDKNIEFLDYDIQYALALAEMNVEESPEVRFFNAYRERGIELMLDSYKLGEIFGKSTKYGYGPGKFYKTRWTYAIVKAVQEQGIGAFGDEDHESIARMSWGADDDNDKDTFVSMVESFASKEEIATWLTVWLKEEIESSCYSNSGTVAAVLREYLDEGDATVEVNEILYYGDDRAWQNTEGWNVQLKIGDETVAEWVVERKYEIYNPITFAGGVDDDWDDEVTKNIRENAESAMIELGVEMEEIRDPDPPDHPESNDNGDFAVLYDFSDSYSWNDARDTWEIVIYESMRDVESAIELSAEMFEDHGDDGNVSMTILRRLTPDELSERAMAKRQGVLFDEPESDKEEWREEWTPLVPEEPADEDE